MGVGWDSLKLYWLGIRWCGGYVLEILPGLAPRSHVSLAHVVLGVD